MILKSLFTFCCVLNLNYIDKHRIAFYCCRKVKKNESALQLTSANFIESTKEMLKLGNLYIYIFFGYVQCVRM
jgi:hypothetical protein